MKARVCVITSAHSAFDVRIFYKQACWLAEAGYSVVLLGRHCRHEFVQGVEVIGLPSPRNRLHRMTTYLWRIYKLALSQQAEIYHFHDPEFALAALLLRLKRKKVIYDVHEDYSQAIRRRYWVPAVVRNAIAWLASTAERAAARRYTAVVAATEYIAARFSNPETITVKNYPVLSNFLQPDNRPNDRVIYIGGISRSRGALEMVAAMERLGAEENVRLTLLGSFLEPDLSEELQKMPGWKFVDYHGQVAREEVWSNLSRAAVGLVCLHPLPAYETSLPVKLFEYMYAGIPVVASDFPFWHQFVRNNSCGLHVDPLNSDEIAKAISYLLENPVEAQKMGNNGRKAVLQKYNWEQESIKLLELYSRLIR